MDDQPNNDSLYDSNDLVEKEKKGGVVGFGGLGGIISAQKSQNGKVGDVGLAKAAEEGVLPVGTATAGGLFTGKGKPEGAVGNTANGGRGLMRMIGLGRGASGKGAGGKAGMAKKAPVIALAGLLAVGVIGIAVVGALGTPMYMISAIDYGLQDSLGFTDTTAILEEQGEYVTAEQMAKGKVPSEYAERLEKNGIAVGQVTASGDFVRTNSYIANIEELDEVAVIGSGYKMVENGNGQLAVLFDGKVITADSFVMAVESNPIMYAAYSEASDISARYYYSDEVNEIYKELELSRGNFNGWQQTGDYEADQESFNQMLVKTLGDNEATENNGLQLEDSVTCTYTDDDGVSHTVTENYVYDFTIKTSGDNVTEDIINIHGLDHCSIEEHFTYQGADGVVQALTHASKGNSAENATKNAANLLNTAISANEPKIAARAFLAIEEPIQRARIDGDGPINEVMNTISTSTEVTYTDVATGESKTETKSILDTRNFSAAVANSDYSVEEAANFSRDRAIYLVGAGGETQGAEETTISLENSRNPDGIDKRMTHTSTKPNDDLEKLTNSIDEAITGDNADMFTSVVGGNRVVEGGSYLSSTINQRVIGAMPSDEEAVVSFHKKTESVVARKAEAERSTKSPFDISSPYTFMGSLIRGLGTNIVKRGSGNGSVVAVATTATVGLVNDSVSKALTGAYADGEGDVFATTMGECTTVKAAGVSGNLYCSSHNTVNTAHMDWTREKWQSEINQKAGGSQFDSDGSIKKNSELAQFTIMGMDREATVGVESAEVCNTYHDMNDNIIQKLIHKALEIAELYGACSGVDKSVSTGAEYAIHDSDSETALYSGYVLYDTVSSLLEGQESQTAIFKKKYYAEHPKDNSRAGVIARRSGMTKQEAEIALAYADYLTFLAYYDASELYVFGQGFDFGDNKFDFIETNDEKIAMIALAVGKRDALGARREAGLSA